MASEAVRYFRGQRRLDYGNNDPSLVKGTVVALCTATIVQSIFTFYGGYTVFVQNWGRSQPGLRELMYGNMISDAVIASIVHSLYSWYLFTLSTGARRWAGWGLASIIMLVSTAQLICCLMAAIGFAQSSPSMSQSDVQLIRTIFRAWLGLCAGTDLIISGCERATKPRDPRLTHRYHLAAPSQPSSACSRPIELVVSKTLTTSGASAPSSGESRGRRMSRSIA